MKVECLNCFTDVIPMSDGRCPACNQPVVSTEQTALTKVTVFQSGPSGSFCMRCGLPTHETIRVRRKTRNADYQPNNVSSLENHPLSMLINFFAGKFHQTVEVNVPLCAKCSGLGVGQPMHIDFERRSMTFVAHRAWKADIERARQAKSDS